MDLTSKLKEWTVAYIGEGPLRLVDFSVSQGPKRTLITILVDTLEGVTIDECALMSRKLAHFIEEGMLIEEAYNLEVSSPGLDFPLSQGWQFQKNLGRKVKVWMKKKDAENVEGTLVSYTEEAVEILTEKTVKHRKMVAKESTWFPLAEVDKIKVQVSFQ
jgi:ribosome maturation factor RimP